MRRSAIRTIIRKRLGETTSAFWTDAELNTYINIGCSDVAWRIKCLRASGTFTVASCDQNTDAAGSNEYVLSEKFPLLYAVNEVYFKRENKNFERLDPTSREDLDTLNSNWMSLVGRTYTDDATGTTYYNYESQASEPKSYYWSREEDVIGFYPPPNDANDGATVKVYYSKKHTDITDDNASPTLPEGVHLAVVDFGVYCGLEDRGWGDRANDQLTKYIKKLQDYTVEKKNEREDDEIIMKPIRNI